MAIEARGKEMLFRRVALTGCDILIVTVVHYTVQSQLAQA